MKNNYGATFRSFAFMICVLSVFILGSCSRKSLPSVFSDGRIEYREGDVTLNGRVAEVDQKIENRSTIETKTASLCDLRFNQSNIVHISEVPHHLSFVKYRDWVTINNSLGEAEQSHIRPAPRPIYSKKTKSGARQLI